MNEPTREECVAAVELVHSLLSGYGQHELADDLRHAAADALDYFFPEAEADAT